MNSVAKAKHENESHALRVQGKTDRLFYFHSTLIAATGKLETRKNISARTAMGEGVPISRILIGQRLKYD